MRYLIFIVLFTMAACSKIDIEPDSTGDPVFSMAGEVDGQNFTMIAGQEGYFQTTDYYTNPLGQVELTGTLSIPGCNANCPPSLQIILKDKPQTALFDSEDVFEPGARSFFEAWQSPEEVMFVRLFSNPKGEPPYQYKWDLGDGRILTRANPQVSFAQIGDQLISLQVTDAAGCTSSQTREVSMNEWTEEVSVLLTPPVVCATDSAGGAPLYCVRAIATGGQPPYTFSFNNQFYTGSVFEIQLAEFPAEDLCVFVEDADGNSSSTCANYNLSTSSPSGTQSCNTQFTYQSELTTLPYDSLQVGSVEIIWTDSDGKEYFSALTNDTSNNSFSVLEVSPYLENEAGQKTMKMSLEFSARLTATDGTSIDLKNMSGFFGFAIPQN